MNGTIGARSAARETLVNRSREKIGKLPDVYVDIETDGLQFAAVKEDIIGRHLTFVPPVAFGSVPVSCRWRSPAGPGSTSLRNAAAGHHRGCRRARDQPLTPKVQRRAVAGQQGEDVADGGFLAGGFGERQVRLDLVAVAEHIVYDGASHIPMATMPGMEDRTVTISALSKTYSVTGWRVGWTIAPPDLTDAIRRVHDFLTVGAPAPLQEAGAAALRLPVTSYDQLAADYRERRDVMIGVLRDAGLEPIVPAGAYYAMTDVSALNTSDDVAAAQALVRIARVAAVPGSSFYSRPELGRARLRFCFSKKLDTLREAGRRLSTIRAVAQHRQLASVIEAVDSGEVHQIAERLAGAVRSPTGPARAER